MVKIIDTNTSEVQINSLWAVFNNLTFILPSQGHNNKLKKNISNVKFPAIFESCVKIGVSILKNGLDLLMTSKINLKGVRGSL